MPKRKITLREWEDKRLDPEDDESESDDFYADDGERDDNISIDEDGVRYYGNT